MVGEERAGPPRDASPGGASLPASRSFVVQLTRDTVPAAQVFRGRVEHIESGRSRRFRSVEDLIGFVSEVLLQGSETAGEP